MASFKHLAIAILFSASASAQQTLSPSSSQIETSLKGGGGVNGGGGGGGVLCYRPGQERDGQSFHLALVMEAWDWTREPFESIDKTTRFGRYYPLLPESRPIGDYLKGSLNGNAFIHHFNPLFGKILVRTIDEVLAQLNQCRELTEYTDDRGRLFPDEERWMEAHNCSPVQLAWRTPVTGAEGESSQADFKIEFNCRLFDRLGANGGRESLKKVNQAVLVLHEALYLMGARLKRHPTSEAVRKMTNLLLTPTGAIQQNMFAQWDLRRLLRKYQFDDYFKLYPADPEKDKVKLARQESYRTAVQIIGDLRRRLLPLPRELEVPDAVFFNDISSNWFLPADDPLRLYLESNRDDAKKARSTYSQALVRDGVATMTDEEAFLFAASLASPYAPGFLSDYNPMRSFEYLLTPGEDDSEALQAVCNLKHHIGDQNLWRTLKPKVQRYCKQYRGASTIMRDTR